MKATCKTCSVVFNKKLTLLEKADGYVPTFCSKECAVAWKIAENKKYIKVRKVGTRQSSKEEVEFGNIIRDHFPKLITQYQLKGYSHHYDFYCPELNLLLEYNGSFWHNKRSVRIKDKKHIAEATKQGVYIAMVVDKDWKDFIKEGNLDRSSIVKMLNERIKNMEE